MFWCMPPGSKCEWVHLIPFVEHYNSTYNTDFRLKQCLDVAGHTKQPEVLLESSSGEQMVIERKSIVWPADYFKYHRSEHDFSEAVQEQLTSHFRDDLYVLEVNTSALRGSKAQIQNMAKNIAQQVLSNSVEARNTGLRGTSPFPWSFHRLPTYLRDGDEPEVGVGVYIYGGIGEETLVSPTGYQAALAGISSQLKDILHETTLKFSTYQHCLRVLVLTFYGDLPLEEDCFEVVKQTQLPDTVDQVWVTKPCWVSENQWEPSFERLT